MDIHNNKYTMLPKYSESLGPNKVYVENGKFHYTTNKGNKSITIVCLPATSIDYGDLEVYSYLGNDLYTTSHGTLHSSNFTLNHV